MYKQIRDQLQISENAGIPNVRYNIYRGGNEYPNVHLPYRVIALEVREQSVASSWETVKDIFGRIKEKQHKYIRLSSTPEGGLVADYPNLNIYFETVWSVVNELFNELNFGIVIDSGSVDFFQFQKYNLSFKQNNKNRKKAVEMAEEYHSYTTLCKVVSIENAFAEPTHYSHKTFKKSIEILESFTSDVDFPNPLIFTAVKITMNQAGTLTNLKNLIDRARRNEQSIVFSSKAPATNDSFLADACFAMGATTVSLFSKIEGTTAKSPHLFPNFFY